MSLFNKFYLINNGSKLFQTVFLKSLASFLLLKVVIRTCLWLSCSGTGKITCKIAYLLHIAHWAECARSHEPCKACDISNRSVAYWSAKNAWIVKKLLFYPYNKSVCLFCNKREFKNVGVGLKCWIFYFIECP